MKNVERKRDIVWSYGGGTQSAAIAVMILKGELPRPDYAIMADTTYEMTETWDYLNTVVQPALNLIGLEIVIVPHSYSMYDLYQNDYLVIPSYTTQNGKVGKKPTHCSGFWKMKAIRKWLREQGVKACETWIGISVDEAERMKPSDVQWNTNVYPLIDMKSANRSQCYQIIKDFGWPKPPKSHCWMCPNMGLSGWQYLRKEYPQDFQKAIDFENRIREKNPHEWLHRYAKPIEQAVLLPDQQLELFDGCDSGYCWT
ncbi:MAG: hypothetical protein AB9888_00245 [Bacteroidales bacterium]